MCLCVVRPYLAKGCFWAPGCEQNDACSLFYWPNDTTHKSCALRSWRGASGSEKRPKCEWNTHFVRSARHWLNYIWPTLVWRHKLQAIRQVPWFRTAHFSLANNRSPTFSATEEKSFDSICALSFNIASSPFEATNSLSNKIQRSVLEVIIWMGDRLKSQLSWINLFNFFYLLCKRVCAASYFNTEL